MSEPMRLVVALGWDALASQAIYHAIAEAHEPGDPDTIVLVSPRDPYVCVGYHQAVEREIDQAAAARLGLPITRRMVGGGAVYLDRGQLFVQWILEPGHVPLELATRYRAYIEPLVETHRSFGIDAVYRPINDIHVDGRKIGGTGAARIGATEVLVGSFIRTIDTDALAEVLRVDSAKMRDKIATAMRSYVTSMAAELGAAPSEEEIIERYVPIVEAALGRPLVRGELTPREARQLEVVVRRFADPAWVLDGGGRRTLGVRIREGATVYTGRHKAQGGLVRVILVVADGIVVDATVEGDVTVSPMDALARIAEAAINEVADAQTLARALETAAAQAIEDAPGLDARDIGLAVLDAFGSTMEPAGLTGPA
jgi:lipoate-protein ligase A